jgi:hypothetical protein
VNDARIVAQWASGERGSATKKKESTARRERFGRWSLLAYGLVERLQYYRSGLNIRGKVALQPAGVTIRVAFRFGSLGVAALILRNTQTRRRRESSGVVVVRSADEERMRYQAEHRK